MWQFSRLEVLPRPRQVHCADDGGRAERDDEGEMGLGPREAAALGESGLPPGRDEGFVGGKWASEALN